MEAVAALLVHRVEDLVRGVEADEVEQLERAHRVAAAEAHRRVEVLARRVVALEHRHRVVEVPEEQRVRDEARLVADDDRLLPDPVGERLDVLEDVVGGDDGPDHLDELLHRRGVEEVHADDSLGVARGDRDLGDGQRRGVRREDRVGRDDLVDPAEQLALEVQVLGHGLDDELAVGEVVEVRRERHPAVEGVVLLLRHLPAGQRATRGAGQHLLAVLDTLGVDLDGDHVDPVAGEHLHDARAHRPESDHTHTGEVTCHDGDPCRGPSASRGATGVTLHTSGRAVTPGSRMPDAVPPVRSHPHHSWPAATSSASSVSRSPDGSGGSPTWVSTPRLSHSWRSSWSTRRRPHAGGPPGAGRRSPRPV